MIGISFGARQFRKYKYSWANYDPDCIYKRYTKRQMLLRSYRFFKWWFEDGLTEAVAKWRFVWRGAK